MLGRAQGSEGGQAKLKDALDRAISIVFPHKKQRVNLNVPQTLTAHTYPLDPLVQICVNLLQNASDAAPVDASIDVAIREDDKQMISLSIEDQGPGIPEEILPFIFEPFYTTKSPGEGTGLGLYTSYALAQELGGELSLNNIDNGGAIATLTLPIAPF